MRKSGINSTVRKWHHSHMLAYKGEPLLLLTSRIQVWWMRISVAGLSSSTRMVQMLVIRYHKIDSNSSIHNPSVMPKYGIVYNLFSNFISFKHYTCESSHTISCPLLLTFLAKQVPFPIGINVGNKNGKDRSNIHEDNTPNLGNLQPSSDKDSISKESD